MFLLLETCLPGCLLLFANEKGKSQFLGWEKEKAAKRKREIKKRERETRNKVTIIIKPFVKQI